MKIMQVIPAIDLRGGFCVRLRQGDYDRETVFGDDPAAMAAHWEAEGATLIHLVDLDGAKAGRPVNIEAVRRSSTASEFRASSAAVSATRRRSPPGSMPGIERVIVGTQALRDPAWFRSMAENYPGRLHPRARRPRRAGRHAGWLEVSTVEATTLAGQFDDLPWPASSTPTSRATARSRGRTWPPRGAGRACQDPVIASGGVGRLEDLERLARACQSPAASSAVLCMKDVPARRRHRTRRGGCLARRLQVNGPRDDRPSPSQHDASRLDSSLAAQPPNRRGDAMTTTYHIADIRNIALAGHGASGKTTLPTPCSSRPAPPTRDRSTTAPAPPTSTTRKNAGISPSTATSHLAWNGKQIHLIDSPGYPDFIGNALSALAAVENVVVTVSGPSGIEVNTRRIFQEASRLGLGRIIAITKMDAENVDYLATWTRSARTSARSACRSTCRSATGPRSPA